MDNTIRYFITNDGSTQGFTIPEIDVDLSQNAGIDLFCTNHVHFSLKDTGVFIGLAQSAYIFQLPPGVHGMVAGRSGNAFKRYTQPFYGVIDSSYRGETGVQLFTHTTEVVINGIKPGTAVAQMVLLNYTGRDISNLRFERVQSVEELSETVRQASGFGSSGNMI